MKISEEKILFDAVRSKAEEILGDAPGCHDFAHTLRVLKNAERILAGEPHSDFEASAIRLAALLHDIARPEEMKSNGGICHAEQGGLKAPALLRELGCRDEALIESVGKAVFNISDDCEPHPVMHIISIKTINILNTFFIGNINSPLSFR